MLKFFLLLLLLFLVARTVLRMLVRGFFFLRKGTSRYGKIPRGSIFSRQHVEEADYEVLESRLNNKKQDVV